jgi:hypothetical protein
MNVRKPLSAETVTAIALVPDRFIQAIMIAVPVGTAMWGMLFLAVSRLLALR